MQPFFEIGIKPARLPAELCDGEAVPQHDIELRFIRRQRQNSVGKGLVVIEIAHCLFRPPDEVVAAWHTLEANASRCELDKALKAGAVAYQDFGGKPAAERVADQMDSVETRLLDEVEIKHCQVRDRADPWRVVGTTKTGMLGHQQLVMLRQHLEERQPLRHAARTVQEKDLRTIPCSAELYGDSPYLEL